MLKEVIEVYKDEVFGTTFKSKKECEKFEKYCKHLKVYGIRWGTDFTEGKQILTSRALLLVDIPESHLISLLSNEDSVVEYVLSTTFGSRYNCVGGIYNINNLLPRWSYKRDDSLSLTSLPVLALITDSNIYKGSSVETISALIETIKGIISKH